MNERNWFQLAAATAFVLDRVFSLGWDRRLFGEFDWDVVRDEVIARDDTSKPERIGKKYQWIALRELLALVSDNFEYVGAYGDEPGEYKGAWQLSRARDIDPSCVIRGKATSVSPSRPWWAPLVYNRWDEPKCQTDWLKVTTDLPGIGSLVGVQDETGVPWLLLESCQEWAEPTPPEQERYDVPTRRLGLSLFSYLVKETAAASFVDWAKQQESWGPWMPRSDHSLDIFIGEFFWSPSFKYHDTPYYSRTGWTRGFERPEYLPCEVLVTTDQYYAEPGYDCSIRDSFAIHLPCRTIVEDLKLSWNGHEGRWFDAQGTLVDDDESQVRFAYGLKPLEGRILTPVNQDIAVHILEAEQTRWELQNVLIFNFKSSKAGGFDLHPV